MSEPKPPGPREFWLRQYSQDGGMYSDIRVMKPSDCDLGVSPPSGHDNLKYYEEVHVIEKSYADKLEVECDEWRKDALQSRESLVSAKNDRLALEAELREAKAELQRTLDNFVRAVEQRDQALAELAEAKRLDLATAVLAKDIDVAAERDAYKADADLKTDAYLRTLQKYENLKEHAEAFSDAAEKLLSDYTCQKCMYPDEPVSHDCDRYEEIKEDGRRQFKKAFEDYQKFLKKGGAE
jgi:hypothetical protein